MVVTRERFLQGMTYDEFKAQMTRNREALDAQERRVELDDADLAPFRRLPRALHVLVIAEDWCPDVIDNLPILARIAQESGKLDLRIFLRDKNLDLMDQYLNQGKFRSIPTFVFFDDAFQEIGRFIERPQRVTERRAQKRQEIFAQHPEFGSPTAPISELPEDVRARVMQEITKMREEMKPYDNPEVVRELREIVEQVPA